MSNGQFDAKDRKFNQIGSRPIRHDGLDKVTGRARFGADYTLPGMLHGVFARSPHAHAKILSIDTRKAEADAEKSEMQAEEMRRQQDRRWMLRERADEITCVWVSRLRDAVVYHLDKNLLAVIYGCGGQPERQAEVKAIIDAALATACNEIANAEELTVEIEDLEESA